MQTIFLSGATGFLGSHILNTLVQEKHNIIIALREKSDTWRINDIIGNTKVYWLNKTSLNAIFQENQIDGVIHTACSYGRANTTILDTVNANVLFGLEILEAAKRGKSSFFINTDTLLPANINNYSLSKKQFVAWLRTYENQIKIVNVKIEHMYGVKDDSTKFVSWFLNEAIYTDKTINLTSGVQKRDFIYIDDVVNAYLLIIKNLAVLKQWSDFDIGTGDFIAVKDFITNISNTLLSIKNIDITSRLNFGAIPYRDNEIMSPILDNSSLIKLGWTPKIDLKRGIEKIINNI